MSGTFNGWTNYETWCVALWIDNSQESQAFWRGVARGCWEMAVEDTTFSKLERAKILLSDKLKEHHQATAHHVVAYPCVHSDLLSAALSEVDWYEIASHLLDDELEDEHGQEGTEAGNGPAVQQEAGEEAGG